MSDSDALRPFLEQACRETLKELARSAMEPEAGGSQSIECIVRHVSARVLHEAGGTLPQLHAAVTSTGGANGQAQSPPSNVPKPLLEDVVATPWVILRGHAANRNIFSQNEIKRQVAGDDDVSTTSEEVAPEAATCETAKAATCETLEVVATETIASDASTCEATPEKFDMGDVAAPLKKSTIKRINSYSIGNECLTPSLDYLPPIRPSNDALGIGLSMEYREKRLSSYEDLPIVLPGSGMGDKPIVCRHGLTMETNTAHSLLMQWQGRPRACLLVAKQSDQLLLATLQDMAKFLASQGIIVVLEPQVLKDHPDLKQTLHGVRTFSEADRLERSVDLVITIGGDGTLTWAVSLFKGGMPPVLAFAAGSLGFLTPFPLESWIRTLTGLLDLHCQRTPQPLVCRMRLRVSVRRRGGDTDGLPIQVQCLNEVLVHRGASGSLVKLNVGVDGENVTLVQGDGLILSTPTGSTAYSLAAGGSMVHPAVPGILLTPVSPHSLSFRPALLPDSAVITVGVPLTARCGAAVSVDGKDLCVLKLGDAVEVAVSSHPVPTICHTTETKDWFSSVQSGLQWNSRAEQKAH